MLRALVYNFVALFVIIDPVGTAAIFAALTRGMDAALKRRTALRGTVIAGMLILLFAFLGEALLTALGITIPAFRIAGGILLFLLATEMVFARQSGIRATTGEEQQEAEASTDISVFPLAIPLLAGPGSLTSIVILMGRAETTAAAAGVLAMLFLVLAIALALLLAATAVMRLLGVTGANVVSRVLGIILAALAAQLVLDGLRDSLGRG